MNAIQLPGHAARAHSLELADHGRIRIESVTPEIDGGRYPIKREVGDSITVSADIFRDGHDKIAADLFFKPWYRPDWQSAPMSLVENDRWAGSFTVNGEHEVRLFDCRCSGRFPNLARGDRQKVFRGPGRAPGNRGRPATPSESNRPRWSRGRAPFGTFGTLRRPRNRKRKLSNCFPAQSSQTSCDMAIPSSNRVWYRHILSVTVDRVRARYAAWYELFPRSCRERSRPERHIRRCHRASRLCARARVRHPLLPAHSPDRAAPIARVRTTRSMLAHTIQGCRMPLAAREVATMPSSLHWARWRTFADLSRPPGHAESRSCSTLPSTRRPIIRG